MNKLKAVAALVLIAVVGTACEDITNPIEEFGQLVDPFVRWEVSGSIGDPGQTIGVIIQLPTRLEEDVTYNYTLGGTAEFGTDYVVVEEDGTPRTDVTAAGGSGTIRYVEDRDAFSRDTIFFAIDFGAEEGRTIDLELTSAQSASGRNVETGYIDRYRQHTLTIEPLPEGVWVGQRTGDFGTAAASVTVTRDGGPFDVGGVLYGYEISDFTGDGGIFGVGIPWVFSVGTGGTVQAPATSHVFTTVAASVTGSYDAGTETLTLNVTLNCCGAAGFGWTLVLTAP